MTEKVKRRGGEVTTISGRVGESESLVLVLVQVAVQVALTTTLAWFRGG